LTFFEFLIEKGLEIPGECLNPSSDENMEQLTVNKDLRGEGEQAVLVIGASGYIDASNVDKFEAGVEEAIKDQSNNCIVVSLDGVEYINSSGLGVLISASQRLSEGGGFCLAQVPDKIARIVRLLGFGDVVHIYESVDEAVEMVRSGSVE
tara:strand:- start:710 stop:1159 length:450 start_codon:yes stop_codon:yes gene_type:complete